MAPQLPFPTADWVTAGHPTVDGFVGHFIEDEDGVFASGDEETGYDLGGRVSFAGGSKAAALVQTVKGRSEDFVYLGFYVRFAHTFDANNVIVVALRPGGSAGHDANTRRFDIFPVWDQTAQGYGAENPWVGHPGQPDPAGVDDVMPTRPGQALNASYWHVRGGRQPQYVGCWKGDAPSVGHPTPWQVVSTLPAGVEIKCRSSQPEPNATPKQCAWGVELKLPLNAGTDWIDLASSSTFHLFVDLVRIEDTPIGSPDFANQYNTQFFWGSGSAQRLTGDLNDTDFLIDPTWYGDAVIPAAGTNPALGVGFENRSENAVGVRDATAADDTLPLGTTVQGAAVVPVGTNRLVARVENTDTSGTASGVRSRFLFAQWGINGPPGSLDWVDAETQGATPVANRNPRDVPHGSTVELQTDWTHADVSSTGYAANGGHHCVMVVLESASSVVFAQDSMRRNMDFAHLSSFETDVTVSDVGRAAPPSGRAYQKYVLITNTRAIHGVERQGGDVATLAATHVGLADTVLGWEHVVHGYIDVGEHLTIRGKKYPSLSPAAEFGYVADHKVANDELVQRLELLPGNDPAAKLTTKDHVVYGLHVPAGGRVTLHHRLETQPAGLQAKDGCLTRLLPFLKSLKKQP
jgi:hypothetical protein